VIIKIKKALVGTCLLDNGAFLRWVVFAFFGLSLNAKNHHHQTQYQTVKPVHNAVY
jgi:hypothetical protein